MQELPAVVAGGRYRQAAAVAEALVGAGQHVAEGALEVEVAAEDDGKADGLAQGRLRQADERRPGAEAESHHAGPRRIDLGMGAECRDDLFEIGLVAGAEAVLAHLVEFRGDHDEPGTGQAAAERLQTGVGRTLVGEAVGDDEDRMAAALRVRQRVAVVVDRAGAGGLMARDHRRAAPAFHPGGAVAGRQVPGESRRAPGVAQALTHAPAAAGGSRGRAPSRRPARTAR